MAAPDAFGALVLRDDDALERALASDASVSEPHCPVVDRHALAFAALTTTGAIVWADENFLEWFGDAPIGASDVLKNSAVLILDRAGALAPIARVDCLDRARWFLPDAAVALLRNGQASTVLVGVHSSRSPAVRGEMAFAFGFTPAEVRLALALIEAGKLRDAAALANISYQTARDVLAAIMRKLGARSQAVIVSRILEAKIGIWQREYGADRNVLARLLGLTVRQTCLALAMARGVTRAQAAHDVSISPAVAKDEMARIYATLGIGSLVRLSRLMTDSMALLALLASERGDLSDNLVNGEGTRFCTRVDGSRIAFSDLGPADGAAVFVLHATGTTRHVSHTLASALQSAGLRVIAVDRPGFGQTDMVQAENPFAAAAADVITVAERLQIGRFRVVARGSVATALAIHGIAAERMDGATLINPDLPGPVDTHQKGPLAMVKRALFRHPRAIGMIARLLAHAGSEDFLARSLLHNLASSPPDLAVFADAAQISDYYRSTRLFSVTSMQGYVAEHSAYARGWMPQAIEADFPWTVILGHYDPLLDWQESATFWRERLPGAKFYDLPDAGRFLHISHANFVAERVVR